MIGLEFEIENWPELPQAQGRLLFLLSRTMNPVETLFKQAIDAHQKHALDDAKKYYLQLLTLEPSFIQAHWQLASIYWQQNDLEKVQVHYQKLLELIPNSPALLNNLAALSLKQNQLDRAIDYFRQALNIDPKHKESRNNLAASLLQKNDSKNLFGTTLCT